MLLRVLEKTRICVDFSLVYASKTHVLSSIYSLKTAMSLKMVYSYRIEFQDHVIMNITY